MKIHTKRAVVLLSLLLLLISTTTVAETVIIDFTGVIMEVESTSSPMGLGDTVVGHVEINEADQISEDFTIPGEAEFVFRGPNTFGSASASPSGWSLSSVPGVHTIEVFIEDNYVMTTDNMNNIPTWVSLPSGFGVGSVIDVLSLDVEIVDGMGLGEEFELFAVYEASADVVDLGRDGIIDFDRLISAAFHIGFYAEGDVGTLPDIQWWGVEGPATATAAVVPVPAAVWLFGSGLLGLIGAAKRRRAAA
jgi:hypothetical protein